MTDQEMLEELAISLDPAIARFARERLDRQAKRREQQSQDEGGDRQAESCENYEPAFDEFN